MKLIRFISPFSLGIQARYVIFWFLLAIFFFVGSFSFNDRALAADDKLASFTNSGIANTGNASLNEEDVKLRLAEIDGLTSLDEAQKKKLEELWVKISADLKLLNEWEKRDQVLNNEIEIAGSSKADLENSLDKQGKIYQGKEFDSLDTLQLESLYASEEAMLKSGREKLAELEVKIENIGKRRQDVPGLIADAKKRLEQQKQLEVVSEELVDFAKARTHLRQVNESLIKKEIAVLEKEISFFDTRLSYYRLQQEYTFRQTNDIEEYLKGLFEFIEKRKKKDAELAAQKAQQKVVHLTDSLPELKSLAQENASFTALMADVLGGLSTATKDQEAAQKHLDKLLTDQRSLREKIKAMGFSDSMGLLLRIRRKELPNPAVYRDRIAKRRASIASIQGKLLELEDKMGKMLDLGRYQKEFIDGVKILDPEAQSEFEKSARELLKAQRDAIDKLVKEYRMLLGRLIDLDSVESRLLDTIRKFEMFVNENVFWIPSASPIQVNDFKRAFNGMQKMFAPVFWYQVFKDLIKSLFGNAWYSMLLSLVLIIILGLRSKAIELLRNTADQVAKVSQDNLLLTVKALVLTIFITSFFPVLLWFVSSLLNDERIVSLSGKQVGEALFAVVPISWLILFLRGCFREKGIANTHFRWRLEEVFELLRRQFLLLFIFSVPLYFLLNLATLSKNTFVSESLGRILFLILVLTTSTILHHLTFPSGAIFSHMRKHFREKLIYKIRYLLYFCVVVCPFILGLSASVGYLFTAQQLFSRGVRSLTIAILAMFCYGIVFRILQLQRRNLALHKHQERIAAEANEKSNETVSDFAAAINQTEGQSIYEISKQANSIIFSILIIVMGFYLWNTWKDVLPAVKIFDQIALWSTEIKIEETITAPDGGISKQFVDRVVNITLIDLVFAMTILYLTFLANRNLEGFLEFALLTRLSVDGGTKFAINTLTRYLLSIVGIVWSFRVVGLGWDKVQWLITGISVGLGFGLQEIFANFVSGLIILFERPLRVGDFIEIGSFSGYVTEIKIRATTILTLDRRELVIPNKDFITGQIINWTLSEKMFRLDFPVGVAYGSDLNKVQEVLLEVARNNPKIQQTPSPKVMMVGFGDNSLNFELRIFMPSPDNFPELQNEINLKITEEFRKNKIQIPFPQRDVHLIKQPE